MKTAIQLENELLKKRSQVEAIQNECEDAGREMDVEEQAVFNRFYIGTDDEPAESVSYKEKIQSRHLVEQRQKEIAELTMGRQLARQRETVSQTALVPAKCKGHGPLKAFSNDAQGEKDAYISGRFVMAKIFKHEPSVRWLREQGIYSQQDETSTQGLELVPTPLEAAILKRLQQLSVVLTKVRTSTMTSATLKVPDRLTGVTVYYPDENIAITPSHETFGQQVLTLRKMATLTQCSSELVEDAIVSIIDELAMDIGYSISLKLEDDIFNGDGTGTYGSVTGLAAALDANSIVTGAGPASSAFTLANYEAVVALNPMFQGSDPEWYCSSAVYANSMLPIMNASGGTPGSEIASGYQRRFLGFPVNIVQVMDNGSTVSTNQAYFGTLDQSVYYGQGRGIQIATSEHYGFNTDSVYIRGTTRNAVTIDNHDTVTPGAITAIATAAA